ncbi:MAG: helix-turn-helix transcriptional regulator [Acutalibacteraceae bacterium]
MMIKDSIKELRVRHSLSQKQLAEQLGVSQQTVAKWESGNASPKPALIKRIAEYFDVSADYLLGIKPKIDDNDVIAALFSDTEDVTDDMYGDAKRFAEFVKQNRK